MIREAMALEGAILTLAYEIYALLIIVHIVVIGAILFFKKKLTIKQLLTFMGLLALPIVLFFLVGARFVETCRNAFGQRKK